MLISGEMGHCTLYFPVESLSAVGSQNIQETIEKAMKMEDKPEILIVVLPKCSFKSVHRQTSNTQIKLIPVKLPELQWSPRKILCFLFCRTKLQDKVFQKN